LRLFVAVDLPDDVRVACAEWRDAVLAPRPALRPVADASLHVTLSFIGTRGGAEAEELAEALERCVRPTGGLALGAGRWLPPRRPSVLAVELDDTRGELKALQAAVAAAVDDREERPFLPHVTVARVRGGQRARPDPLPAPRALGFAAAALTLYRSHTAPGGAVYEPLWRRSL
jgi:2'-5' RNA ligase